MNNEERWKYAKVEVGLIDEAEENANEMSADDFQALCDNIGLSGLSSVPTCYKKENGRYVMISGHHRLRACKKLGYRTLGILYAEESELTKDEIIAIQLSHNSLHGEDNKSILKKLFSQIQNVDFKKFAHINIDEIGTVESNGLNLLAMKESYTVTVVLYSDSVDGFNALFGDIRDYSKKSDVVLLANGEDNEDLYLALRKEFKDKLDIKSTSVAFGQMLTLAAMKLNEINGGE